MRPKSDMKSRAAIVKDLRRAPALQPENQEFLRARRERNRSKAFELLAQGELHDGYVGRGASEAFHFCASALIIEGEWTSSARAELSLGLAYVDALARWHELIGSAKHNTADTVADHVGTQLSHSVWAAFIWAHLGQWESAKWMAAYLQGYIDGGAFTRPHPELEADYLALFRVLLKTILEEKWPAVFPPELGPYKVLLEARAEPTSFAKALVAVADLRMARRCGYAQVDDTRGFGPYDPPLLMGNFEFSVMSAELWAIRALARKLDGLELNLEADHPWLSAGFAQAPENLSQVEGNELLTALQGHLDAQRVLRNR